MAENRIVLVTDIAWQSTEPEEKVLAEVGAKLVLAQTGCEEELLRLVPDADAILTNWKQVPASVVRAGDKLQVISRYGIGVDNIAVAEATRLGILVTNVPVYCLDEVSEHTLALVLVCARKVCQYNTSVHAGEWSVSSHGPLLRIRGKTLGIIGFGNIARTLAPKLKAFGLQILVFDPFVDDETVGSYGCSKAGLEDLLGNSDFVTIHAPLTDTTRGLLNAQQLHRMKPTAFLINTSRGAIVDPTALVQALSQGWIAGAALDVFTPEPLPVEHPLLSLTNVILTPHVSFYSEESLMDLEIQAAQNVAAIFSGRRPSAVVNPEILALPRWAHLR